MMHKSRYQGFTLIELLVVVAIFGLVVAASVPAMGRFLQSWKLNSEVDQMASTLRAARGTAIMKNINAVFRFNTTSGVYSYFEDTDRDGTKDVGEYETSAELTPGILFDSHTLPGTQVTFGPKGNSIESGTITLSNVHNRNRTITIYGGTGNVRVD